MLSGGNYSGLDFGKGTGELDRESRITDVFRRTSSSHIFVTIIFCSKRAPIYLYYHLVISTRSIIS